MSMTGFLAGLAPVARKAPLAARRPCQRVINAVLKRADPHELVGRSRYGFDLAGPSSDVIPRHVYVYGVWEPDISAWAAGFVRPGDVVLDVGANIGYFSLLCATKGANVIAVEPSPRNASKLRLNLTRNGLTADVVQAIAGPKDGVGAIYMPDPDNDLGRDARDAMTVSIDGYAKEADVPCVRGDDLLAGRSCRMIKVDTEGDELNVLLGLTETLAAMEPGGVVLTEVSERLLGHRNQKPAQVFELMADFDAFMLPNDYSPRRYSDPGVRGLQPLPSDFTENVDVVFVKRG